MLSLLLILLILLFLQRKHTLLFHTARVMDIAWSPNSERIVSGSIDTNVIVWDAIKGEKSEVIKRKEFSLI